MIDATERQREDAILHAAVWKRVFQACRDSSEYYEQGSGQEILSWAGSFAMTISNEYGRIASSGKIEE